MKKSVILMILAVYILSVCVVGFFGIKVRMYYETVNVEAIDITTVTDDNGTPYTIGTTTDGNPMVRVKNVNKGTKENPTIVTFKVYYEITPANATDPTVLLNYDDSDSNITVTKSPGEQAVIVTFKIEKTSKSLILTIQNNVDTSISSTIALFVDVKMF